MYVLTGIHTAGKTTIGNELRSAGFEFYPEIATDFIEHKNPWTLNSNFDERVFIAELNRDKTLLTNSNLFFIETWHIGNLAYARVRNPKIAENYINRIRYQMQLFQPIVYFLDLEPAQAIGRTSFFHGQTEMKQAIKFYDKVRSQFYTVFDLLHIGPVFIDATQSPQSVVDQILTTEHLMPSFV